MPISDGFDATATKLSFVREVASGSSGSLYTVAKPDGIRPGAGLYQGTLTSAAAATAVTIVPDGDVGANRKVVLEKLIVRVNGTTVWGTTATVTVQDSAGNAFVTIPVASLTSQAVVFDATANNTYGDAFSKVTGGTAGKGLQVVGNANGTGSDLIVTTFVQFVPTA